MRRSVAVAVVGLVASGGAGLLALATTGGHGRATSVGLGASTTTVIQSVAARPQPFWARPAPPRPTISVAPAGPLPAAPTTSSSGPPVIAKAALAGCPVPPHPPSPPGPPPWHPSRLVPASALPPLEPPAPWKADLTPVTGKGMWIWQWSQTDGGDAAAVVAQAAGRGLHQLWVRVGDSMNGFYGAHELDALVPVAHAAGLSVIAWGFPYLYDPVGDAGWTAQVLAWRGSGGQTVDGFSADIEEPTEGVDLTAQRAGVYLESVRRAAGSRPVVATVYPPTNDRWTDGGYPYSTMAPYVDAFAPMIYWECTDPGGDAAIDVARLSTLRPVDVIGQAYNMAYEDGRSVSPSAAEITEFLGAARRAGAIGASFWVWQSATPDEWSAVGAYRWAAG